MISMKYVVEPLDIRSGTKKQKKILSGRFVKLYKYKTTTIFLTYIRFYHSEEREIHRYNFIIKTSLYQGNILFFKTKGGVF